MSDFDTPDSSRWNAEGLRQQGKRLAGRPDLFMVAYCLYGFNPKTKGMHVTANFMGEDHRAADVEMEKKIRAMNYEFTKIVEKIFGVVPNPAEMWTELTPKKPTV